MRQNVDISNVTTGNTPPEGPETPANAGIFHNRYLYLYYLQSKEMGFNDDPTSLVNYMRTKSQELVSSGAMPPAGAEVIENIISVLNDQGGGGSGTFDSISGQLQEILSGAANNPALKDTMATGAASIAYYSSKFWSETTHGTTQARWSVKDWVHVIAADLGGYLGGGIILGVLGSASQWP